MRSWQFIFDGARPGAENMAIDEELLHQAARGSMDPVLRFYTWDPPAVSIGRFQDRTAAVRDEVCKSLGIDIVRRITGGRAVLHHRELTYSIVSPTKNPQFPNTVLGTYRAIAGALLAGLKELGVQAEMASRGIRREKSSTGPSCFSSPSWYEITVGARKLVGSAQRKVPGAFLQHGSVLIEYDPDLEASVIPGGGSGKHVASLAEVLGRPVTIEETANALLDGFRNVFHVHAGGLRTSMQL